MVTITAGLLGGLLGAAVTGAAMRSASEEPAPAATVWAMYLGDGEPAHYETRGLLVHLLYGAAAGAVFASFARSLGLDVSTAGDAVGWALVWAGALLVVAVGFWGMVLIGEELEARWLARLGAMHVAYGVVLGLVAGVL